MSKATEEFLKRAKRQRSSQTFMNSFLMVAVAALAVAVVALYMEMGSDAKAAVVVVEEAQHALNATCPKVDQRSLPPDAQQKCAEAKRNELPQKLAEAIDDPDPDDPERQDREVQDSETQDPEQQESEMQDPELPDTETDDPDPIDDPDPDDPEIDDPEIDDPEIQDPEIQDPEEQNAPICPDGYARAPFHYFGPDGVDNTGDEEDWMICKKVG